jgi:hypothetical protein
VLAVGGREGGVKVGDVVCGDGDGLVVALVHLTEEVEGIERVGEVRKECNHMDIVVAMNFF